MRYAIVENGMVTNMAVAADDFAASQGWVAAPADVDIGWGYDGAAWVEPNIRPIAAPQSVSMRQARLALLAVGKLKDVADAIAALPSPQRDSAQIEWEYSTTVQRQSPLVLTLGAALGLDSAALDALFFTAIKL